MKEGGWGAGVAGTAAAACLLRAKCFRLLSPLFAAAIVVRGAVDSL